MPSSSSILNFRPFASTLINFRPFAYSLLNVTPFPYSLLILDPSPLPSYILSYFPLHSHVIFDAKLWVCCYIGQCTWKSPDFNIGWYGQVLKYLHDYSPNFTHTRTCKVRKLYKI
jgi:hypothetical protein